MLTPPELLQSPQGELPLGAAANTNGLHLHRTLCQLYYVIQPVKISPQVYFQEPGPYQGTSARGCDNARFTSLRGEGPAHHVYDYRQP